jgi:hypothetical protein
MLRGKVWMEPEMLAQIAIKNRTQLPHAAKFGMDILDLPLATEEFCSRKRVVLGVGEIADPR